MNPELDYIRRIVHKGLEKGYVFSVNDGEEWVVFCSNDEKIIMDALGSTDEDYLSVIRYDKALQKFMALGGIHLVYQGNTDPETVPEVICDHTDNAAINELVNID